MNRVAQPILMNKHPVITDIMIMQINLIQIVT